MKKILQILILVIFISSCSSTKLAPQNIIYFDHHNIEITKSEYEKLLLTHNFLEIPGEYTNQKKLIFREQHGQVTDIQKLKSLLEGTVEQRIDSQ
ncbi:hypothetical protein [Winogradskyella bathintestinalis]|uniref:DUF4296 domain-containing protein n=1 Tax=Winogradskyella bathintestinalis TaxID=3035208 RepID=A0ABT7ZWU1_9FLAO|nr:hypothetical protein [Winogradskyella bathintestinalis]MDN3493299.1 hypothetical protein [Winogradskyella bathintestinalis]